MRVIPAIDLKDGQCVRLQKGDYGTAHKVAENAVETARRFLEAGASLIHMVDLDAAKDGSHANYGVVAQVIRETGASARRQSATRNLSRRRSKSTATRSSSVSTRRARPSARTAGWTTAARTISRSRSAWSLTA